MTGKLTNIVCDIFIFTLLVEHYILHVMVIFPEFIL